jgi:hypothetical protein
MHLSSTENNDPDPCTADTADLTASPEDAQSVKTIQT